MKEPDLVVESPGQSVLILKFMKQIILIVFALVITGCAASRVNERYETYGRDMLQDSRAQLQLADQDASAAIVEAGFPYLLSEMKHEFGGCPKSGPTRKSCMNELLEQWQARCELAYKLADFRHSNVMLKAYPDRIKSVANEILSESSIDPKLFKLLTRQFVLEKYYRDSHNENVELERDELKAQIRLRHNLAWERLEQDRARDVATAQTAEIQILQNFSHLSEQRETNRQLRRIEENQKAYRF